MDARKALSLCFCLLSLGLSHVLVAQSADSIPGANSAPISIQPVQLDSANTESVDTAVSVVCADSLIPLIHRVFYPLRKSNPWMVSASTDLLSSAFIAPLELNYSTLFPQLNSNFMEFSNVGYNGRALTLPLSNSDRGLFSAVNRTFTPVEDIPFFDVPSPFTQLAFRLNYNEGQYSRFAHARSFDAHRGVFFSYERSNSQGAYARQESLQNNLLLNAYGVLGKGTWQAWARWMGWQQQENGGISDRDAFLNNTITDRLIFPVQIAGARSERLIRNYGGRYSRDVGEQMKLIISGMHDRHRYDFSDNSPDELYYTEIYRDSSQTLDSMIWAASAVSFALATVDSLPWYGELSVSLHRDDFKSADVRSYANWFKIQGYTQVLWGSAQVDGRAWLNLGDYFGETFGGKFGLTDSIFGRRTQFQVEHWYDRPGLFWSQLYFNHAQWVGIPQVVSATNVRGSMNLSENHNLELGWSNYLNYIYLNSDRKPSQQDLSLFYAKWQGAWTFWTKWHLDAHARVQSYAYKGDTDPIRLPNFHGMGAIYIEDDWFAGALNLQMGMRGRIFSRGLAMEYAPELGYNFASNENIQVGGYPMVDVFLHGRIRTFYAYLLLQHAQKGFSGYDYFATAYQPLPERSFRIGLSWKFFN